MSLKAIRLGSRSMLTDLYQLTMAQVYFMEGRSDLQAAFHLHYRKPPFADIPFVISAGLDDVVETIEAFKFDRDDIQWLASLKNSFEKSIFHEPFLNALQRMKLTCTVKMAPEGTVIYPHQPLLTIQGPLIQTQLLETILLTLISFPTLVATKAFQIRMAAEEDGVLEFGLRRAQGMDGGLTASRASYIGGVDATSNVLAGQFYHIPVRGTHAHSYILSHPFEIDAFQSFTHHMPNDCTLLIDTFDTLKGLENAIKVALELKEKGKQLAAIRLDSGDLLALSKISRQKLDHAGLHATKIIASGDLNAEKIKTLKSQQAPIDVWGIGTALSTSYEQPALGAVYKMGAIRQTDNSWHWKSKISDEPTKKHLPGLPGIIRLAQNETDQGNKANTRDLIYNQLDAGTEYTGHPDNLLQTIFLDGNFKGIKTNIAEARTRCLENGKSHLCFGDDYKIEYETNYRKLINSVNKI